MSFKMPLLHKVIRKFYSRKNLNQVETNILLIPKIVNIINLDLKCMSKQLILRL